MISIKEFSFFNIILATFSIVTTSLALYYSIKIYKQKNTRILLLYAGTMLGFIINITGVYMGLLQIFIFGNYQAVPTAYCVIQGYLKVTGLFLFNTYQILVDIALYLNIYNFKLYKQLFHNKIMDLQVYVYSCVFLFCTIFLLLRVYGPNNPFIDINCTLRDNGQLLISLSYIISIFLFVFQPLIAVSIDVYVMTSIIMFYKQYQYQLSIKKRIKSLILFPITYLLITISEFLTAYFLISSHYNPPSSNNAEKQTNYTTKVILQAICFILISSRGGIIACLFGNLMISSKQDDDNIEFTLPSEVDQVNNVNESLQLSESIRSQSQSI